MSGIQVEKNPSEETLAKLGVSDWPVWEKEVSEFPWEYDETETCYLLKGEVEVTPEGGVPVAFGAGDLVAFPAGMKCVWKVSKPVRKHYRFG